MAPITVAPHSPKLQSTSPILDCEPDYRELFLIAAELLDVYAKDYVRLKDEHERVLLTLSDFIGDGAFLVELIQAVNEEVDDDTPRPVA